MQNDRKTEINNERTKEHKNEGQHIERRKDKRTGDKADRHEQTK